MTREGDGIDRGPGDVVALDKREGMRLLASVRYGRLVFTENALPAVRPANHVVDHDRVVIRTRLPATFFATSPWPAAGVVVAYQADHLDPQRKAAWNVVVTGLAHAVTGAEELSRYQHVLDRWVKRDDAVVAIEPEMIVATEVVGSET